MGVVGLVINNINEILGLGVAAVGGYAFGAWKQKHIPWFHLNPIVWYKWVRERLPSRT